MKSIADSLEKNLNEIDKFLTRPIQKNREETSGATQKHYYRSYRLCKDNKET